MNYDLTPLTINLRGRLMDLSSPVVMGIVNVTPDSFYSGSRNETVEAVEHTVGRMLSQGAAVIDLGGYSTRPGAPEVSADEEMRRLETGLNTIRRNWPDAVVSVDTFRAEVARRCVLDFEADIINDISGGQLDKEMFATVADLKVPYILMHTRGTPATMQHHCDYADVTAEVLSDLAFKDAELRRMGVTDVIIDPGFGFAKNTSQNFEMMANLEMFHALRRPILVGVSRKSMIFKSLGCSPAEALNGTTVLNTAALLKGASILRVHDVGSAVEAIRLVELMRAHAPGRREDARQGSPDAAGEYIPQTRDNNTL